MADEPCMLDQKEARIFAELTEGMDETVGIAMLGRLLAAYVHYCAMLESPNRMIIRRRCQGMMGRVISVAEDDIYERLNPKEGAE